MGRQLASDLANNGEEYGISLAQSLTIHLRHNHYPPVPMSMVAVCISAIHSYNANFNGDEVLDLPEGTSWRGKSSAPAWAIIESHHLGEWCDNEDDYYEE
jgi:hypothetical protein